MDRHWKIIAGVAGASAGVALLIAAIIVARRKSSSPALSTGQKAGLPPGTTTLTLASQAFPSATGTGALVHVSPAFDAGQPWTAVVYYRGYGTCVEAVASSTSQKCGHITRSGNHLAEEFDRAPGNTILIMPELRVNATDHDAGNPGQLGEPGGFKRFMEELTTSLGIPMPSAIDVYSHSGGFTAAAKVADVGGLPVRRVALLDSFYGQAPAFTRWIRANQEVPGFRFTTLYHGDSVSAQSRALQRALQAEGLHTTDQLDGRLVFRGVVEGHGEIPRAWLRKLLVA